MRRSLVLVAIAAALHLGPVGSAVGQDMLQYFDLKSDEFTKSEYTREEILEAIKAAGPDGVADFSGKRLNGLDLSGLDLTNVKLQSTRISNANFKGAKLDGVVLDQAWALDSDFTGASFKGASLFSTQFMGSKMDGADFTKARVAADFSRASLKDADFTDADLAADMTNQSMGLMRGVFRSTDLEGASFENANLARVVFEYAKLNGANLRGANLMGSELAGADLTGADVTGANFNEADVNSARLLSLQGKDAALNMQSMKNLDRAYVE